MEILKDIIETNKKIIPKSLHLTWKNWPIIFTGLIYFIIVTLLWSIAPLFSILAGILITLVQSALISNYLYLIENILRYGKISFDDFKEGFKVYTWNIYGIMVVIWFANYGANLFLKPIINIKIGFISLWLMIQIIAVILLNCLPEVIYQKNYQVGESFIYSYEFIKENWIDWFVPNGIFILLFYMGKILYPSIGPFIIYFLSQLLLSFVMIYRGLLFQILSSSSRRKRIFTRNIYR